MSGHPEHLPDLFLDRSLGRRQVPEALRRAGLRLRTLAEVYGIPQDEEITDTEWLELAGRSGWAVLMKDERIRYRASERAALIDHSVMAFCLTSGNLKASQMADIFLNSLADMTSYCRDGGPFLYSASPRGLRRLDLT